MGNGCVGVVGVTGLDAGDGALLPTPLLATTVNVYAVPLFSPVTTCELKLLPALLSNPPGGEEMTVYPVVLNPVSDDGANATTA